MDSDVVGDDRANRCVSGFFVKSEQTLESENFLLWEKTSVKSLSSLGKRC